MSNNLSLGKSISVSVFIWITALVTSCATKPHQALERLEVGMDKSQVVELLGAPQRSHRQRGHDLWVYEYLQDGQPLVTRVTFSQGRVANIQTLRQADLEAQRRLRQSQSLEEFEKEAQKLSPEERSRLLQSPSAPIQPDEDLEE